MLFKSNCIILCHNLGHYLVLNASKITASENVCLTYAGGQTLWTQIRLLLQEQSDLGSHCLSMRLQIV